MDGAGAGFGGVAIWNELIDGVDQFLDIVDFLGTNCYADSFAHNPVLGALFGLTGNRKFLVKQSSSQSVPTILKNRAPCFLKIRHPAF